MKILSLLFVLVLCTFYSQAQDVAMAAPASYLPTSLPSGSAHHRSALASAGTYTILGGVAVGVFGFIEYSNATKTSGPFTFVNEGQQNSGRALEYVGGLAIAAGIVMVIVGSVNNRAHREPKVSLYSPRPNEMGLAYRL